MGSLAGGPAPYPSPRETPKCEAKPHAEGYCAPTLPAVQRKKEAPGLPGPLILNFEDRLPVLGKGGGDRSSTETAPAAAMGSASTTASLLERYAPTPTTPCQSRYRFAASARGRRRTPPRGGGMKREKPRTGGGASGSSAGTGDGEGAPSLPPFIAARCCGLPFEDGKI